MKAKFVILINYLPSYPLLLPCQVDEIHSVILMNFHKAILNSADLVQG